MKNQRGSVTIFTLAGIVIFFMMLIMTADIARLYAVKVQGRHALNLALRAACSEIDMEALADPEDPAVVIKTPEATASFHKVLRKNLDLNSSMYPNPGSICDGPVSVLYFQVINDPPFSYSYGGYSEYVEGVGATGIIEMPVHLSDLAVAFGQPRTVSIRVHSTVLSSINPNI